jgi:hypothetical protein
MKGHPGAQGPKQEGRDIPGAPVGATQGGSSPELLELQKPQRATPTFSYGDARARPCAHTHTHTHTHTQISVSLAGWGLGNLNLV